MFTLFDGSKVNIVFEFLKLPDSTIYYRGVSIKKPKNSTLQKKYASKKLWWKPLAVDARMVACRGPSNPEP